VDDTGDSAIIRAAQDRLVEGPLRTAHDAVREPPALDRQWLTLPRSHGRAARDALVEVRVRSVTLTPDREKYPHAWAMTWTLVEVWEPNPPPGAEAVPWRLWTREPAGTADEVWEVVRKYTCRWPIEEFHLVLKSGCRAEALPLETWPRRTKALVLYSVVAARVVSLRDRSRAEPEAPATVLLSEDECVVLTARFGKAKPSPGLTLRQAVLWIGRLGGHLNRKGDGMPGVRTLWRGLRDLGLLVEGYRVANRLLE
jgi:Transposase Tn5 dimerisation domain